MRICVFCTPSARVTSFKSTSHLVTELVTEKGRQWMIGFGSNAMTTAFPILITQIIFFRILDENLFMPSITLSSKQTTRRSTKSYFDIKSNSFCVRSLFHAWQPAAIH